MSPIAVACEHCGVGSGCRCVRPGGGITLRPGRYHLIRVVAAARLDENDKEMAR